MVKPKVKNRELVLRLYVAGNAPNSLLAMASIRTICAKHFELRHKLEIVDLLQSPLRALADAIVVTPTLLKLHPLPATRLIGDLSDTKYVLLALAAR